MGSFFLTNVRIVWHANSATNFNVSLPYMQIVSPSANYLFFETNMTNIDEQKSLRLRESKFGRALVLETFAKAGGYILGFRVDPQDKINLVFQEIQSLFQIYSSGPIFGVDFTVEAETPGGEYVKSLLYINRELLNYFVVVVVVVCISIAVTYYFSA